MKKVQTRCAANHQWSVAQKSKGRRGVARICSAMGLVVLVGAIGIATARQGKPTTGGPVPVTVNGTSIVSDTDNIARQPFATRAYPSAASAATFTVPAGKRLVITDVAAFSYGSTTVEDVALYTTVAGLGAARTIPFTVNNQGMVYADASIMDFADPGTTVTVAIDDANGSDNAGMNVDMHGYYVNLP
jgi:hypothetical protein